jgi:hypothetical protein
MAYAFSSGGRSLQEWAHRKPAYGFVSAGTAESYPRPVPKRPSLPPRFALPNFAYHFVLTGASTQFEKVVESVGGYGERVENAEDLPAALERAVREVRNGRQALLNVICSGP